MLYSCNMRNLLTKNKKKESFTIYDTFFAPYYQQQNVAKLRHLENLGLDLQRKKVIEFGAGIGDYTLYYLIKSCDILPTEGRAELCNYLSSRFDIPCMLLNIEKDIEKIKTLPHADVIHCYGLLYHISNPEEFLTAIS